jgi:pimeloyl-ACP methyl ester carboxylesterase
MKNIVLIPAMGCDGRLYSALSQALSPLRRVSIAIADRDNLKDCVAQVLADAPEQFIVLGTSFGGRVALELALGHADRVEGLVVTGAGAGAAADPTLGLKRAARLRGSEFETVVTEMADMVSHMPGPNGPATRELFVEMARDNGGEMMAAQSDALAMRLDMGSRLSEVSCPSLMLWGREDKFSPALDGLKMSTQIPNGRYVEISGCGHFPSLEAPEETVEILLHWLQDARLISD